MIFIIFTTIEENAAQKRDFHYGLTNLILKCNVYHLARQGDQVIKSYLEVSIAYSITLETVKQIYHFTYEHNS